jgi:hypothetical protein
MPTDCSQDSFDFGTVEGHRVVGAFDGGQITSHADGLLLGASNKAIHLIERLARCFKDGRDPNALLHTVPALVGSASSPSRWATRTSTITTSVTATHVFDGQDAHSAPPRYAPRTWASESTAYGVASAITLP